MAKKGTFFGVKCADGYLVDPDRNPIVADKSQKGELKRSLKKLKRKRPKKFDTCKVVDVSNRVG